MKNPKTQSGKAGRLFGAAPLLGNPSFVTGCCGIFMVLLAGFELYVGGVPDGFWYNFSWGMAIGLPIVLALFLMPPMEKLRDQAAKCRKARESVRPQRGPEGRVNGLLQKLRVLLLCLCDLIYYVLKIYPADRNIVTDTKPKMVRGVHDLSVSRAVLPKGTASHTRVE